MPPWSGKTCCLLHILLLTVSVATAQSATSGLSVGAAVGISVAVSVTACVCIALLVICLLVKRWRPSRKSVSQHYDNHRRHGNSSTGPHGKAAGSQSQHHQSLRFSEEGRGASTSASSPQDVASRVKETLSHSKKASHGDKDSNPEEQLHTISVPVISPEDLRFKVCRQEGEIQVASDPAHSSLCSREGIRSGDQILGVYVDIQGSPDAAHPKEVSELLAMSADYRLVVDFRHRGQLLKGPPETPLQPQRRRRTAAAAGSGRGQQQPRPISAAEKALKRTLQQRGGLSLDVPDAADFEASPVLPRPRVTLAAVADAALIVAKRSRKSRAPEPPPCDRDSVFAIRDRRKRRRNTPSPMPPEPEKLPQDQSMIGRRSSSSSSSDGSEEPQKLPKWTSDLSRLDVVDDATKTWRSLPSNQEEEEPEEVLESSWFGAGVELNYDHYELEEQDVRAQMAPPSAQRPVVDCCTQFDCLPDDEALALAMPVWDCLPNHPVREEAAVATWSQWESLENFPAQPAVAEAAATQQLMSLGDAVVCQAVRSVSPSAELLQMTTSSPAADGALVKLESDASGYRYANDQEADQDGELASYLETAARRLQRSGSSSSGSSSSSDNNSKAADSPPRPESGNSSSIHTVQEEAAVELRLRRPETIRDAKKRMAHREDSLVELSRSMALRDVEVATVILLDSEARQQMQAQAAAACEPSDRPATTASSGRSTVQEDSIHAELAADRREFTTEETGSTSPDEAEVAAMLNADFELAAAGWTADGDIDDLVEQDKAAAAAATAASRTAESPPLLDAELVSEIVHDAQTIWTTDCDVSADNSATATATADQQPAELSADFQALLSDDSQLTGENLERILRQLEAGDDDSELV